MKSLSEDHHIPPLLPGKVAGRLVEAAVDTSCKSKFNFLWDRESLQLTKERCDVRNTCWSGRSGAQQRGEFVSSGGEEMKENC